MRKLKTKPQIKIKLKRLISQTHTITVERESIRNNPAQFSDLCDDQLADDLLEVEAKIRILKWVLGERFLPPKKESL